MFNLDRRIVIGVIVFFVGALAVFFYWDRSRSVALNLREQSLQQDQADFAELLREARDAQRQVLEEMRTAPSIVSLPQGDGDSSPQLISVTDQKAIAVSSLARFRHELKVATDELNAATALLAEWSSLVEPLKTNEQGKKLAADAPSIRQYQRLMAMERPTSAALESWRQELTAVGETVEQGSSESTLYAPAATVFERLSELATEVRRAGDQLRADTSLLKSLLRSTEGVGPGSATLVEEIETELERTRLEELARQEELRSEERQKWRAELDEAIRRTEAAARERDLALEESKTAKLTGEAEAIRRATAQATADRAADAAYQSRVQEAMRAENLRQLDVFFAKDYLQPREFGTEGTRIAEPQPMSLTALKGMEALEGDEKGIKAFLWVVAGDWTERTRWNMRTELTFPHQLTAEQTSRIRAAQQLLRDFGDIYVDQGKLAE